MPWWRRPEPEDRIVGEVELTEPYFMAHPTTGVTPVLGEPGDDSSVFRTVAEPHRWFVVVRGVTGGPGWVTCQLLAEVAPTAGVAATTIHATRMHDERHSRHVVARFLDVEITKDQDQARAYAELPPRVTEHQGD